MEAISRAWEYSVRMSRQFWLAQLSVRIPPEAKLKIGALSIMQGKPHWRVVFDSIEYRVRSLPASDRRKLKELLKRLR